MLVVRFLGNKINLVCIVPVRWRFLNNCKYLIEELHYVSSKDALTNIDLQFSSISLYIPASQIIYEKMKIFPLAGGLGAWKKLVMLFWTKPRSF